MSASLAEILIVVVILAVFSVAVSFGFVLVQVAIDQIYGIGTTENLFWRIFGFIRLKKK